MLETILTIAAISFISFVVWFFGWIVAMLQFKVDDNKATRWPILLFAVVPIRACKGFKRFMRAVWQDIVDAWEKD